MPSRVVFKLAVVGLVGVALAVYGCKRTPAATSSAPPETPTVRIYAISTLAGAMEPCGCQKDMLGGIDHAAAFVRSQKTAAPHHLVLGAGPLLFMDPVLDAEKRQQDGWKAVAIAQSLADVGLSGWAPGANDWAAGAGELTSLAKSASADLLAANLTGATAGAVGARTYAVNGEKVGVAGVSLPAHTAGGPEGVELGDAATALAEARDALKKQGVNILVAVAAVERGQALRLAEQVPGFAVMIVGKPSDRGEGNDAPIPPVTIGSTLVVQTPNHLQSIAVVDLFVRGDYTFRDGSGLEVAERRAGLERRIAELERRIAEWEKQSSISKTDLDARRSDLERLRAELSGVGRAARPKAGSFFEYRLEEVRESLGSDPAVAKRLGGYYRRVNDHNREAFKDRKPPPVAEGKSGYLGAEDCANCHEEAYEFWKKTPHATAYATLADNHKQFNLDCVACHVTGYDKPGGSTVTHVESLESVQCEVCHGPGSRHEDDPEDSTLIVASPPKTLCAPQCHHPPHVGADWSSEAVWSKILGPGHGKK